MQSRRYPTENSADQGPNGIRWGVCRREKIPKLAALVTLPMSRSIVTKAASFGYVTHIAVDRNQSCQLWPMTGGSGPFSPGWHPAPGVFQQRPLLVTGKRPFPNLAVVVVVANTFFADVVTKSCHDGKDRPVRLASCFSGSHCWASQQCHPGQASSGTRRLCPFFRKVQKRFCDRL